MVPNVVPPSGMSLKSLEKTGGWVCRLSQMPSPSTSWHPVEGETVILKPVDVAVAPLWSVTVTVTVKVPLIV